jgi:hypothetical protein
MFHTIEQATQKSYWKFFCWKSFPSRFVNIESINWNIIDTYERLSFIDDEIRILNETDFT